MSKNKHTPGPWRTVRLASSFDARIPAFGVSYGPAGNRLAIVDGEGNSSTSNEANARLIAAAPELLEALHKIEQQLDYGQIDAARRLATDAITKAEGRP